MKFQLFVFNFEQGTWRPEERVNGASYRHSWVYAEDVSSIRLSLSQIELLGAVTRTKEPLSKCYNSFSPTTSEKRAVSEWKKAEPAPSKKD